MRTPAVSAAVLTRPNGGIWRRESRKKNEIHSRSVDQMDEISPACQEAINPTLYAFILEHFGDANGFEIVERLPGMSDPPRVEIPEFERLPVDSKPWIRPANPKRAPRKLGMK
jgi:hypothetical protein